MLEKILKAKHWQIFILIFGVPFIISLFVNLSVFIRIIAAGYNDPFHIFSYMKYFSIIMVIATLPLYLWYWSIGTELQKVIPTEFRLNTTLFKVFMILAFIIPFFYLISFSFFIEGYDI